MHDAGDEPVDPRVAAVLEVLRGRPTGEVARRWAVDPALLHRWVRAFVDAGTSTVTNEPDPETAAQRDRFLAAFAHEVRTPLTVAQGWTAMLRDGDLPAPLRSASVDKLHGALVRLAERTLDVELLAAASLGRLTVEAVHTTVAEVVDGVVEAGSVSGEALAAGLVVDRDLFSRVIRDLWQAAGLPPVPRSRHLEVESVGPWVELRIVRQADPIEPRLLQALFEPFDTNDDATGVTIGLYLARALTVGHGGTLGIDQDDDHATFWVRVPRHPAPRPGRAPMASVPGTDHQGVPR